MERFFDLSAAHETIPASLIQSRPSPEDAIKRASNYAMAAAAGQYPKRKPLTTWKVIKPDGSFFYSLRDGNTTFHVLLQLGLKNFPVEVQKEIEEKDLTPAPEHG